jgi:7,8-dihydropterin-6-yl-methyl-4-(beta-D-ribofuranosyl)aminobenzene 5'-phosphate synthase
MKIIIIYDNEAEPGFAAAWGFSCLVKARQNLLFDTGGEGKILLFNMSLLKIDPKSVNKIVISHNHWDHKGGVKDLLRVNKNAELFHPTSFSNPTKVCPAVYSTGAMGSLIKEQSLVVKTSKGNVVITGCAHPGLGRIIKRAESLGKVYAVIGGFHDFSSLEKLKEIELIAPCHCTKHKQKIQQRYPEQFKRIGAGSVIRI